MGALLTSHRTHHKPRVHSVGPDQFQLRSAAIGCSVRWLEYLYQKEGRWVRFLAMSCTTTSCQWKRRRYSLWFHHDRYMDYTNKGYNASNAKLCGEEMSE